MTELELNCYRYYIKKCLRFGKKKLKGENNEARR